MPYQRHARERPARATPVYNSEAGAGESNLPTLIFRSTQQSARVSRRLKNHAQTFHFTEIIYTTQIFSSSPTHSGHEI